MPHSEDLEDAPAICKSLHEALVTSVKRIQSACPFGDTLWLQYVKAFGRSEFHAEPYTNAPRFKWHDQQYMSATRDPKKYNTHFLTYFLLYVKSLTQNLANTEVYSLGKYHRCVYMEPPNYLEIQDLVFLVGSEVLEGIDDYRVIHISLPTQLVVSSNVAIGMMLHAFGSGQLEFLSPLRFSDYCKITCIHLEGGFWDFPENEKTQPHVNRMDNINAVLRQFGVDFHATYTVTGERVLTTFSPQLKSFIAVGQPTTDGRCCFHIDPKLFGQHLALNKKKC